MTSDDPSVHTPIPLRHKNGGDAPLSQEGTEAVKHGPHVAADISAEVHYPAEWSLRIEVTKKRPKGLRVLPSGRVVQEVDGAPAGADVRRDEDVSQVLIC